ncbi:MAG: hypothetical protein B6D62_01220 [Candidatus Cloacimonas sp. 4484_275]|nr:MAG: hypothetical protein B6D62_01220 [Candidatus Cloacimonas sp. 4484_275]
MKIFNFFIGVLMMIFFVSCTTDGKVRDKQFGENFWDGETFTQKTVNASKLDDDIIRAKIDGVWQEFHLKKVPKEFVEWNVQRRIETIEKITKGEMPGLDGPHNGIVATYGYRRKDSDFRLNNAIKGMGFLPKRDKIKEVIKTLKETKEENFMKKLEILKNYYENADSVFDMTKQVSLELYTTPKRGTQTFLNQMTNPASVIVFMDIPTFKLKTIAYLLHPKNPNLNDYEKDVVEYVNLIHSYFHGEFSTEFIAVIYNVVEVYNSSPGVKEGMGTRIVP